MEDGELCVRMHMRLRGRGRGRQCMVGQVAETSGRRFDKFGELHMVRPRSPAASRSTPTRLRAAAL